MALKRFYNNTLIGLLTDLPTTGVTGTIFLSEDTQEFYGYDQNNQPFFIGGSGNTTLWTAGTTNINNITTIANSSVGGDATGSFAVAEGRNTTASGDNSHSEGINTIASGEASHSEGIGTTAIGDYSHVGGRNNIASGETSFNHSRNSNSLGLNSAILGGSGNTTTTLAINTVVLGGFNITANTANSVYVPTINFKPMLSGDTSPTPGTVYYDINDNVLRCYDGTSYRDLF